MNQQTILIIDDEPVNRKVLARVLADFQLRILEASNGLEALALLQAGEIPDAVVLDLMMPQMGGLAFLRQVRELQHSVGPVLVCSGNPEIHVAIEAMKLGAWDYIEKPIQPEILRTRLRGVLDRQRLKQQNWVLQAKLREVNQHRLLGNSSAIQGVQLAIERLADSKAPLLLYGEPGSGKRHAAKALHDQGAASAEAFEEVECRSWNLSFAQISNKGTVYLHEIADLSPNQQSDLLAILDRKAFRVVASTSKNLQEMVENHTFRSDLLLRLGIERIAIPPLRERREDIELLVAHFINKHARQFGRRYFTQPAMDIMRRYAWPGNVRELEGVVLKALQASENQGEFIDPEHLNLELAEQQSGVVSAAGTSSFPLLSLRQLEQQAVVRALEFTKGNRRQAAEILEIGEATLYRKIKEFGL